MSQSPKAKHDDGLSLADKLFPRESEDLVDSILSIPPEQRRLHTETYDFSIATIRNYLETEHVFVPKFQRGYVWKDPQASRLIESLIIQCPIPVIYLSQEPDERLSVIDGNQRLRSIKRYLENQFALKGLTAYPELEGKRFFELDPRFQRHILNRTLRCIVILKDTHPQVKFDVFERLNTGAVKLSAQELRHGLYHGSLVEWIDHAASNHHWRKLLNLKRDNRMRAEEFVVRFLALHYSLEEYEKPLSAFLNKFLEANRDATQDELSKYKKLLEETTSAVSSIYGDLAFKVIDPRDHKTILSSFNAALFDAQMVAVSRLLPRTLQVKASMRKDIQTATINLFENEQFLKAITLATSDVAQIKNRVRLMQSAISDSL